MGPPVSLTASKRLVRRVSAHVKSLHSELGFRMPWASFWFSCAQLERFRLNPSRVHSLRLKFNVAVFVETSNGIKPSEHTLEKFLGSQLVLDTRAKVIPGIATTLTLSPSWIFVYPYSPLYE
jgi:hypothetical protein